VDIVLNIFATSLLMGNDSCLEYTTYDYTSSITTP